MVRARPTSSRPKRRSTARERPATGERPQLVVPKPAFSRLAEEAPHAHIVCRVCGRIQGIELTELDAHLLTELAANRPDGWSVERIAFSVAGACLRCREGPRAP